MKPEAGLLSLFFLTLVLLAVSARRHFKKRHDELQREVLEHIKQNHHGSYKELSIPIPLSDERHVIFRRGSTNATSPQ